MTHSPHRLRSKPTDWAAKFAALQEQESGPPPPGFFTATEWETKLNRRQAQTRNLLRMACDAGQMERKMFRVQVANGQRFLPHYRLLKPARSGRSSAGKAF
jgi:hypothetical protein